MSHAAHTGLHPHPLAPALHAPAAPRLPNWQTRLAAYVRQRSSQPLVWGVHDCALFAAGAVAAVTGRYVPLPAYIGARQGLRTLRALGGLRAIATRELGDPIPAQRAGVGDVVLVATGKREALALCNGVTALGPGPDGLVAVPLRHAVMAWRV